MNVDQKSNRAEYHQHRYDTESGSIEELLQVELYKYKMRSVQEQIPKVRRTPIH